MILFCSSMAGCTRARAASMRSCSVRIWLLTLASAPVPVVSSVRARASAFSTISVWRLSSTSMRCSCAAFSCPCPTCSICALLRKPKMPMEVINIRIATLGTKYSLMAHLTRLQYSCNHTVITNLATSRIDPMITTGITDAAKIAVRPTME